MLKVLLCIAQMQLDEGLGQPNLLIRVPSIDFQFLPKGIDRLEILDVAAHL
jgi:hypothetical protein